MKETVEKIKKIVKEGTPFGSVASYHLPSLRKVPEMASIIYEIRAALEKNVIPEKVEGSSTAVYLMKSREGEPLAIFKPKKELDEYYLRESLAYRLDKENFAGIPPTIITSFFHPVFGGERRGTCQLFVEGHHVSTKIEEILPSYIRRIATFDIRVSNQDRHHANLLRTKREVIPIDHTLILPSNLHLGPFIWLNWEQSKTGFSLDEKSYIANLDPEEEREMLLKEFKIDKKAADLFYVSSQLLKKGVERNLTAYNLGFLVARKPPQESDKKREWLPAPLEKVMEKVGSGVSHHWDYFKALVEEEVEGVLQECSFKLDLFCSSKKM